MGGGPHLHPLRPWSRQVRISHRMTRLLTTPPSPVPPSPQHTQPLGYEYDKLPAVPGGSGGQGGQQLREAPTLARFVDVDPVRCVCWHANGGKGGWGGRGPVVEIHTRPRGHLSCVFPRRQKTFACTRTHIPCSFILHQHSRTHTRTYTHAQTHTHTLTHGVVWAGFHFVFQHTRTHATPQVPGSLRCAARVRGAVGGGRGGGSRGGVHSALGPRRLPGSAAGAPGWGVGRG